MTQSVGIRSIHKSTIIAVSNFTGYTCTPLRDLLRSDVSTVPGNMYNTSQRKFKALLTLNRCEGKIESSLFHTVVR